MADIIGTNATDNLFGTNDAESIEGLGGEDFISGFDGDDTLIGGAGLDSLFGDFGEDSLVGGSAEDDFTGGEGNDTLDGTAGADDDGLFVFDFDEVRYDFEGGGGAVSVDLRTGQATDTFGNIDTIIDVERVRGTSQADTILGGDRGNDDFESFIGLAGDDTINGRSGIDRVEYNADVFADGGGNQGVVVNLETGIARDGFGDTDTLISIEQVRGTVFADELIGSDRGGERFEALTGSDVIDGGGGENDKIDYSNAHFFNAFNFAGSPEPAIVADLQTGLIADRNNLFVDRVTNIEDVTGTINSDTIRGDVGANVLDGDGGDDLVRGRRGNDEIFGNFGNDRLFGGRGRDTIEGGSGDDVIRGGSGRDVFVFNEDFDAATIRDFGRGGDRLDLSGLELGNARAVFNNAREVGEDVEIDLGDDGIITLVNIELDDLERGDLIL